MSSLSALLDVGAGDLRSGNAIESADNIPKRENLRPHAVEVDCLLTE